MQVNCTEDRWGIGRSVDDLLVELQAAKKRGVPGGAMVSFPSPDASQFVATTVRFAWTEKRRAPRRST